MRRGRRRRRRRRTRRGRRRGRKRGEAENPTILARPRCHVKHHVRRARSASQDARCQVLDVRGGSTRSGHAGRCRSAAARFVPPRAPSRVRTSHHQDFETNIGFARDSRISGSDSLEVLR